MTIRFFSLFASGFERAAEWLLESDCVRVVSPSTDDDPLNDGDIYHDFDGPRDDYEGHAMANAEDDSGIAPYSPFDYPPSAYRDRK